MTDVPRSSHRFRLVELARREHANRVSVPSARSTIVEGTESLSSSRTVICSRFPFPRSAHSTRRRRRNSLRSRSTHRVPRYGGTTWTSILACQDSCSRPWEPRSDVGNLRVWREGLGATRKRELPAPTVCMVAGQKRACVGRRRSSVSPKRSGTARLNASALSKCVGIRCSGVQGRR
jgi:hypothetical protein